MRTECHIADDRALVGSPSDIRAGGLSICGLSISTGPAYAHASSRDALLILLRAVQRLLMQPVGQPVVGAEFGDKPRNVIAPLPATRRAFDAQHLEPADQAAYRSVKRQLGMPFLLTGERGGPDPGGRFGGRSGPPAVPAREALAGYRRWPRRF